MTSSSEIIEAARKRVVNRRNPLLAGVPDWVSEWHSEQVGAIGEILKAYNDGAKVVVLDAPTGIGKTLIGETVRLMMEVRGLYVCTTKSLQDQFLRDFGYSKVMKGRGNYATELFASRFRPGQFYSDSHISCDDCNADGSSDPGACDYCSVKYRCPYEVAKQTARRAQVAVLNTSYWLSEVNRVTSPDNPAGFTNWPLVVFDEADTLEGQLMGHVSVEVSERRMKRYGLKSPKVTVVSDWKAWLNESVPVLRAAVKDCTDDVGGRREARGLERLLDGLKMVRTGLDSSSSPWVYTGRSGSVSFKPARVDQFGEQYIWRHSDKFLLMSATVISGTEMLASLGFRGDYHVVRLGSPFRVSNRRVIVRPVVDMTSRKKDNNGNGRSGSGSGRGIDQEQVGRLVDGIKRILSDHPGDNTLIHCVSYDLAGRLFSGLEGVGRRVETYREAADRARVIEVLHKERGVVVIAPSLDRGVDLPGDAARVQIIAKCPYPYLGDRQIAARLYGSGGRTWYNVQTVRTLVQMCGRAVRNKDDWAVTYIVDASFKTNLFGGARSLFPKWWLDSLVWERPE